MNAFFKMFVGSHVALYRLSGGKIGGGMFGGRVLLLTTKGNKTGKSRTVPVMYFDHDGKRVVIASFGGSPTHPAWFKNMQTTPEATVEVGREKYRAKPVILSGDERSAVWKHVIAQMPRFAEYDQKVAGRREIPVVALEPIS